MASTQGAVLLRQIRQLVAAQCPSQQTDQQLLQQFIATHDEAAFAVLVQRHGALVLGVCRSALHHPQDAEDVFQATFLVLARKAHTIRKQQSLSSWLHGVAHRLALKAKTQAERRRARENRPVEQPSGSTLDDLTWRELRVVLHEELERLPETYRAALLLCYWEGKTRDEAAAQLNWTVGAFKKHLERARNLLRGRLLRRGLAPSAALVAALLSANGAKAAVGTSMIHSTTRAAVAFVTGKAAAGVPAAAALALAEGATRTMYQTKWAAAMLAALCLGGLMTGLGLWADQGARATQPAASAGTEGNGQPPAAQPPAKQTAAQKTDEQRLVGTWRITKGRHNGQDSPPEFTMLARLVFTKDGKMMLTFLEESKDSKYKLLGPGQIDITFGPNTELSPGIYKFESDDRLTLCFNDGPPERKRPTEFSGEQGTGQVILFLARAKPGEDKLTPEEIAKYKDAVDKVREAAARAQSANNLKQIGLAMHSYHDVYKSLPAHAIYSKDGKTPLLSWRVAILPFVEHQALYQEFKLDEPWNSPHNRKLIAKMPTIYAPLGPLAKPGKAGEGLTYYQVFAGPDTVFDGPKQMMLAQITDGLSNTILVLEAKDPVIWTKPDDLVLPKEKDKMPAVGGLFKNGMNVLFGDGSVQFLRRDPPAALLRALVTPNGNEEVDIDKLKPDR
jgi:RNA polymerase sigma factor (sigma-70 family)